MVYNAGKVNQQLSDKIIALYEAQLAEKDKVITLLKKRIEELEKNRK